MSNKMTLQEAFEAWTSEIRPMVVEQYGEDDSCALSESWSDYTDGLCKDGQLGDLQYHFCPAGDDSMPDDDREFILESMGVSMIATSLDARTDGFGGDWSADAYHWSCQIIRNDRAFTVEYSCGSGFGPAAPALVDVMYSLIQDTQGIEGETFESWADNYGFDTDSRKAERTFNACKAQAAELDKLFTSKELTDLGELYEDY